jgi:hypothetical protein
MIYNTLSIMGYTVELLVTYPCSRNIGYQLNHDPSERTSTGSADRRKYTIRPYRRTKMWMSHSFHVQITSISVIFITLLQVQYSVDEKVNLEYFYG